MITIFPSLYVACTPIENEQEHKNRKRRKTKMHFFTESIARYLENLPGYITDGYNFNGVGYADGTDDRQKENCKHCDRI